MLEFIKLLIICSLLLLASACNSLYDATLLHGNWKVSSWKVVSSGQAINQKMDFNFNPDESYHIDYGSQKEEGRFYIAGEYLHTKEHQGIEKSVLIQKLTKDSLVLNMNRAGSLEEIVLVRPLANSK